MELVVKSLQVGDVKTAENTMYDKNNERSFWMHSFLVCLEKITGNENFWCFKHAPAVICSHLEKSIMSNLCLDITAYFSHAFLHWLVEVNFKCNNCGRKFMCTMDFDVGGKHWYWNKVSDNRPIKYSAGIDRPLEYVEHQYGEMQGDGYSIISFNCIHWAKDFYSRLTGEPLTGDPSS